MPIICGTASPWLPRRFHGTKIHCFGIRATCRTEAARSLTRMQYRIAWVIYLFLQVMNTWSSVVQALLEHSSLCDYYASMPYFLLCASVLLCGDPNTLEDKVPLPCTHGSGIHSDLHLKNRLKLSFWETHQHELDSVCCNSNPPFAPCWRSRYPIILRCTHDISSRRSSLHQDSIGL